jgi:hypothetical protein
LCKKLEGDTDQPHASKTRDRLTKLFDTLSADAMAAIEELLKIISLDGKKGGRATKGAAKATTA